MLLWVLWSALVREASMAFGGLSIDWIIEHDSLLHFALFLSELVKRYLYRMPYWISLPRSRVLNGSLLWIKMGSTIIGWWWMASIKYPLF